MEKLERSKFTRAGEIANERLVEAVLDPDRYPEGTTFIAAVVSPLRVRRLSCYRQDKQEHHEG